MKYDMSVIKRLRLVRPIAVSPKNVRLKCRFRHNHIRFFRALCIYVLLSVFTNIHLKEDENIDNWIDDPNWLSFIAVHSELYEIARAYAKAIRRNNTVSESRYRVYSQEMEGRTKMDRLIVERMVSHIKGKYRFDDPIYDEFISNYENIEEVVVYGNMFDSIELDPGEFSLSDILLMRGVRIEANDLYRQGRYDEAYPLLLELAKRGFKDAQARLSYILFTGTVNVRKSNLRALGWLAAAAHGRTEPTFRVLFKRYMAQVPENVLPSVELINEEYRSMFSHSEHMKCSTNHRFQRGIVKRTYCQFKLEAIAEACGFMRCSALNRNVDSEDEVITDREYQSAFTDQVNQ